MTGNLAQDIEDAADGEPIEQIICGIDPDARFRVAETFRHLGPAYGMLLAWATARPLLDRDFDDGFGAAECPAIYAWTASKVLFVHEYDGSTRVSWVPRNPSSEMPRYDGDSCPEVW